MSKLSNPGIVFSCPSPGVQAHGHDLPACPESGLPEGGALPQSVPEASQGPAAQVSITPALQEHTFAATHCGITQMFLKTGLELVSCTVELCSNGIEINRHI